MLEIIRVNENQSAVSWTGSKLNENGRHNLYGDNVVDYFARHLYQFCYYETVNSFLNHFNSLLYLKGMLRYKKHLESFNQPIIAQVDLEKHKIYCYVMSL